MNDKTAHLEIYFLGKWHIYHGVAGEIAWTVVLLAPFMLGIILGLLIGFYA